ncbi:MAG: hypothetical protein H5T34_04945 [Candidatus Methanomethyliales bacterium]|nr:hypothetical protein [Candidatus Methanomethylicales archaeon]
MSREALCPFCGEELSVSVEKDKKTGEIKICLFCEGFADDEFAFEILTGLTNDDLLDELYDRKTMKKEMKIKVIACKPDEDLFE